MSVYDFNKGDRVKRFQGGEGSDLKTGDICVVLEDTSTDEGEDGLCVKIERSNYKGSWYIKNFELVESQEEETKLIGNKTMEKKIIKVLAVNKKTGKVEKNESVVADNEQSAILKAFGVDAESMFIKTTEEGSFKEDKPVEVVSVKESKAKTQ